MSGDIFMTGGAGFLGRAILARYAKEWPDCRFTVFSRDEAKHARTRAMFPEHRYILGDVRDADRLQVAMAGHRIVIHTAAMKYVPQGEVNVSEAVAVNVDGSRNICSAAIRHRVERVIGVSSDKACRPVNVYGMTKFLMERLFQEADSISDTRFNLIRYGNVISSTGSVMPMFRRQAREGRVTLTNPDMTRFWITIDEAVEMVVVALREESGGTVLVPRLGAISMREAAVVAAEIELGQKANDVRYDVIGQRFGEKVHEELVSPVEIVYTELTGVLMGHRMPNPKDPPHRFVCLRMWPVTAGIRDGHIEHPYTSDHPDRKITMEEFKKLVLEAPE